jgi:hypothetical protein
MLFISACIPFISWAQWSLTGNAGTVVATNFIGTTDNRGLVFRTNNLERMRFTAGGNLGIGLTSPAARLQVAAAVTTSLTGVGSFVVGDLAGRNLSFDENEVQARNDSVGSTLYLNFWGGNLWAGRYNGAAMYYANASSGRLGLLGLDDAEYSLKLHTNSTYGGLVIDNHAALLPSIYVEKTGLGAAIFAEKTDPTSFSYTIQANTSSGGYAIAAFSTAENAGGVYAVSSKQNGLYADGGAGASDYAGYFNGNVFTTGLYQSSDNRLKKNIKELPNALTVINQLKPKLYEYRQDGHFKLMGLPLGEKMGFLAQDVELVLPGLIKESVFETRNAPEIAGQAPAYEKAGLPLPNETIEFKALNYVDMIPLLVKAVQEQQQMIGTMQAEIDRLKTTSATNPVNIETIQDAMLLQNIPNPAIHETTIQLTVPMSASNAMLLITTMDGKPVKQFILSKGSQNVVCITSGISAGQYIYSLVIDGKTISSKKMIIAR